MAKKVYKIPQSLALGWLDAEITLASDNGVGFRPLSLKVILSIILSGVTCLWCVLNTPISAGGPLLIALFVILWIALTALLLRPLKNGDMAVTQVPALLEYLPKSKRHVLTRSSSPATGFYSISGLESIDEDRGLIHFRDGDVGFAYRIVGSASVLLFDEDRNAILDRVDSFYRNMKTDYELIFLTNREAQNVRLQIEAIDRRMSRLGNNPGDDQLLDLLQTERDYLRYEVGGKFRSIHQYMIIKAKSEELLTLGRNMLSSEVESSTLMFKRVTALFDNDLTGLFASVYKGKETL